MLQAAVPETQSPNSAKKPSRARRILFRLLTVFFGFSIALAILEIGLRIYNPFGCPLKGDRIELPVYKKSIYHVPPGDDRFDEPVYQSRNSLGFRGPEPPRPFKDYLTIVAVGGSTTECRLLTDGKTWPEVLGRKLEAQFGKAWVNNAGYDGHSTYGHLILTEDYLLKLKPKYVLYLTGTNDVGRDDLNNTDFVSKRKPGLLRRFITCFETYNTIVNIQRHYLAMDKGLVHKLRTSDKDGEELYPAARMTEDVKAQEPYRATYKERLRRLVELCRQGGIEPIFITQPTAYVYPPAGAEKVTEQNIYRAVLDSYNDAARQAGAELKVAVIDLASAVSGEKDVFYDMTHFTKKGAERVADVVAQELGVILEKNGHKRVQP